MGKQTKSGKKRRSLSDWVKHTKKILHARHYFLYRAFLALLFNEFENNELKVKDEELCRDIKDSLEIIKRITERKKRAITNQYYKGYIQSDIQRLNEIMLKTPIRVGVDFTDYAKVSLPLWEQEDVDAGNDSRISKKVLNIVKKLSKQKTLPQINLFPFPYGADIYEVMDEKSIRALLTMGLFDYLHEAIYGRGMQFKRCEICKKWFVFHRSSRLTCSDLCRSKKWNRSHRKECQEKTKRCRKKQNIEKQ